MIVVVIAGVALWAINSFIPMARSVKTILNSLVAIVLCIWLLQAFGVISGFRDIQLN